VEDQPEGKIIHSSIGDFIPEVLSYEPVNEVAHFCPSIECPFCGYPGQYNIEVKGKYANYCPSCELTWKYRLERIPFSMIGG